MIHLPQNPASVQKTFADPDVLRWSCLSAYGSTFWLKLSEKSIHIYFYNSSGASCSCVLHIHTVTVAKVDMQDILLHTEALSYELISFTDHVQYW